MTNSELIIFLVHFSNTFLNLTLSAKKDLIYLHAFFADGHSEYYTHELADAVSSIALNHIARESEPAELLER